MIGESVIMWVVLPVLFILLIYCFYMLIRNRRVYYLRKNLLDEASHEKDNYKQIFRLHNRYPYDQMLFSFRSIKSFREELFSELRKTDGART